MRAASIRAGGGAPVSDPKAAHAWSRKICSRSQASPPSADARSARSPPLPRTGRSAPARSAEKRKLIERFPPSRAIPTRRRASCAPLRRFGLSSTAALDLFESLTCSSPRAGSMSAHPLSTAFRRGLDTTPACVRAADAASHTMAPRRPDATTAYDAARVAGRRSRRSVPLRHGRTAAACGGAASRAFIIASPPMGGSQHAEAFFALAGLNS